MASRTKARSAALCGLLAVGLALPALATAEWTTPVDLSQAGQSATNPQVAVGADGNAVFTWARSDGTNTRVQTRTRNAAGVLSGVQTLSSSGQDASLPQVAVDADGNAVFTWQRSDGANFRIQARVRSPAGALTAVQTLSDPGQNAGAPQVAVDPGGDAVFTWSRFDGANFRIQARARSAGGALSAVQNLSDSGRNAFNPQVAIDVGGDAVFVWQRFDGTAFRAQTRARSGAGALSPDQTLSTAGRDAVAPHVGVDAGGDAVFVWSRFDGMVNRVQARARSAAGVLSGVQTLTDAGQDAAFAEVGVDPDGDAVFTWLDAAGANDRAQTRARSAAGTLTAVQNLSNPGQDAAFPQVAVDSDGKAAFTWLRSDGTDDLVEARTRSAAGALRPLTVLSDPEGSAAFTQVAVDPDGDAVVGWRRFDGANDRIQASAGP